MFYNLKFKQLNMNIFKILSSGDGTIKEPNLSAFLAYLLNPKADHGLGSSFLQKVLKPFMEESVLRHVRAGILQPLFSEINDSINEQVGDNYLLDLSINSRFNVDVVLEKALKDKKNSDNVSKPNGRSKTKEVVDIIIKIENRFLYI